MNRIFRTTVVETSGVRTIAGGGTNASDAGQALLNLGGAHLPSFFYDGTDTTFLLGDIPGSYADYGTLTQVHLGNSVTSIGSYAFRYNSLTSVTIPNSVTTIDGAAFQSNSLTSVTIPNSVTGIGNLAFGYNSLTGVTIPNSVTSIGSYAFRSNQLTGVTIPNSVTSIGFLPFNGCTGLTSISVGSANTIYSSIGGVLFNKTATTLLTYPNGKQGSYAIPNSVTSIGGYAFFGCTELTSVNIPNSVTSIGNNAFGSCTELTSVSIPNSVNSIGNYAFRYNSLTSVTIPNSVTSIGTYAFAYSSTLVTVNCYAPATAFIGSAAFYYTASPLTINARASDGTWTPGGQSFQGTTVNVVKNL